MLPTFLVIGAAKSGTSSLFSYLRGHPEVFVTTPKELHFFSHGWRRGLGSYEGYFEGSEGYRARGEASTSYTQAPRFEGVPARIAEAVPDVRLVYLIRNPVERIRSQYVHYVDRGREGRPLDEAVRENPDYLDTSRYAYQLGLYLEHFRRDQVLVLANDQLRDARTDTMREVFGFLGVDPDAPIRPLDRELNRSANKRQAPPLVDSGRRLLRRTRLARHVPRSVRAHGLRIVSRPFPQEVAEVSPELEEWIWSELADDVVRLRELVGPDFDLWGRA
ncbi:sulfotransferase [Nocardioides sp. GXQ0305]|uniref:sulfotransferase n=1 Tax=Nocardioides sp. GXQ0305 TaxID=3423912 RepID=UPI003D7D765D